MSRLLIERLSPYLAGPCLVIGALTVFAPLIDGGTTQLPMMVMRLVLLCALGGWLVSGLRTSTLSIPRTSLWWPVAAFSGLMSLSLLWSAYVSLSIQWVITIMLYVVFFGLVLHAADSTKRVRGLAVLLLVMGLFEGGLGIVQYLCLGEPRARGTFFNPNYFATYETACAVLALALLPAETDGRRNETLLLALAAAISCVAIVLAQSRGGTVAFLLATAFVGLFRFGKKALVFLLILILCGIMFPNPVKQRITAVETQNPYAYTRFEIWENSLHRIAEHPMGLGLGMYKYGSFQSRFPIDEAIVRYGKRAETAHNEYLQLAVELGLPGLALLLIGIGMWANEAKRVLSGTPSKADKQLAVGLCAGVLAVLVHAGVDSVFHEPALALLVILMGGLVLALNTFSRDVRAREWHLPFRYHPARMALVVCATVALAVLVIRPGAAWFMVDHGNRVLTEEDNLAAMTWYRYASIADPGSTAVRDGLARLYLQRFAASKDPEWLRLAKDEMEVAMALNPLDGRMPYRLGTIYLMLADQPALEASRDSFVARAEKAFEKAIFVDPFSPFGYFELGKVRRRQGDRATARQLLEQAIAYEPNFIPARAMLAELATEIGQRELAGVQLAAIHDIRSKYQGWTLTPLERQFLDVPTRNF
jgi:O-antigen ligase